MTLPSLFMTVVPLTLIPLVFLLGPLRRLAEVRAMHMRRQGKLVEMYQSDAAKFLRLTADKGFDEHQQALIWAGDNMLEGSSLIKGLIFARAKWRPQQRKPSKDQVPALPDEARHAFASAVASAMIASSYQSPIRGRAYRAAMSWFFTGQTPDHKAEIIKPDQVVYRYRVAKKGGTSGTGMLEEAVC